MSIKILKLKALTEKVNTACDGEVVRRSVVLDCDRISTGSLALDYTMGINAKGMGGFAVGHGNCLVGLESSGKTTTAIRGIGNAQRTCSRCYREGVAIKLERLLNDEGEVEMAQAGLNEDGDPYMVPVYTVTGKCSCYQEGLWAPEKPVFTGKASEKKEQEEAWDAYLEKLKANSFEPCVTALVDVENTLDHKWAIRNQAYTMVLDPDYTRPSPVLQFVHIVPGFGEEAVDVTAEFILSGEIDFIVVDSIPAMTPRVETEASASDQQRGELARMLNKAFRRWDSAVATVQAKTGKRITMVYIQQWRKTMSAFAENVMPGGMGQRFSYSIITDFYTSDKVHKSDLMMGHGSKKEAMESAFSLRQNFSNKKNKTWPPLKKGSHVVQLVDDGEYAAGEIHEIPYLVATGIQLGVIEKKGSKYDFRGTEYTAMSHIENLLRTNITALKWIRAQLRLALYASVYGEEFS